MQADRARHPANNLVLHLQDALQFRVETFGPQLGCLLRLDQPRVDAHTLFLGHDAALEQITHSQLAADLSSVYAAVLVSERGVARDDRDPRQRAREITDETVGNAIGQVIPLGIAAVIVEREDRDQRQRGLEPLRR